MPLEVKGTVVTQKVIDLLDAAKASYTPPVERVYYGDQDLMPKMPAITVESMTKIREDEGQTHRWGLLFGVSIIVYHGRLQSSEITKKTAEQLSEQIETTLDQHLTLDGMVVFGHVTRIDYSGQITRLEQGSPVMYRASRIVWEGISRENFP